MKTAKQIESTILKHRRYIHQHPELSFKEYHTNKYIADYLTRLNIKHYTLSDTGIVAFIGDLDKYSDNCVAFRAEMDALPINETTGLPFASLNEGIMHACGHDMHIAMLLGAAEILQSNASNLKGIVKLIFQPGEEVLPGGALDIIEQGCLQNPVPRAIFAGHIDPCIKTGTFEACPDATMATTCEITINIKGVATHGSTPHLGSDPLLVATAVINFAQTFIIRYNDPLQPAVLSICSAHGGNANNAFPESVALLGTLRTFSKENRDRLLALFVNKVKALCEVYDTYCEVNVVLGYPPVANDKLAVEAVKECVSSMPGCKFNTCQPKMWAEDFAYYAERVPACMYFIGCAPETSATLHSSNLAPDEGALICGADVIVGLALNSINN